MTTSPRLGPPPLTLGPPPRPQDPAYGGLTPAEKAALTRRAHGDAVALPAGLAPGSEKLAGAERYAHDHKLSAEKVFGVYGGLSNGEKAILTRRAHGEEIALPKGVAEDPEKMEGAKVSSAAPLVGQSKARNVVETDQPTPTDRPTYLSTNSLITDHCPK